MIYHVKSGSINTVREDTGVPPLPPYPNADSHGGLFMSKHPKTEAKNKGSDAIRQEFNEACFQLGQEIRNEERAQENQGTLRERLANLERQFNIAKGLELEAEAKKARNETTEPVVVTPEEATPVEASAT